MYELLRDYQKKAIHEVEAVIAKGILNVLVQSPTGSGKSVMLAYLIKQYLAVGKKILLIAHKIELIEQLYDHVQRWLELKATIMANTARYKFNRNCQVCIASIQSWSYCYNKNDYFKLPQADIVVVDEAHHSASASYSNLFNYYNDAIKLGFTATPKRLDGKGLRFLNKGTHGFQYLVKGVPVQELIEQGHLSNYILYGASKLLNAEGKVKTTGGDYNARDLAEFVATELAPQEVVNTWFNFAYNKKTVLYPVSVELSKVYCEAFAHNGVSSAHIDSKTSAKTRKAILEQFRSGSITVLSQHSIIIEGVDVPDIECVQFLRPTKSMVIWFQAIGRALRPAKGKSHAIIIDHTTTHKVLPMPDFPVHWSLDPLAYNGIRDFLTCSKCGHDWRPTERELVNFTVMNQEVITEKKAYGYDKNYLIKQGVISPCWCYKCNHQESHQWKVKEDLDPFDGVKEKVKQDSSFTIAEVERYKPNSFIIKEIEYLFEVAEQKGYKKSWVGYKVLDVEGVGYPELLWVADQLGYKRSWASYRYQELNITNNAQNN